MLFSTQVNFHKSDPSYYWKIYTGFSMFSFFSCFDYCKALYTVITQASLHRLQLVRNVAARIIASSRKQETPILAFLLWLPVHFPIGFKMLLLTFKVLNNPVPSYMKYLLPSVLLDQLMVAF